MDFRQVDRSIVSPGLLRFAKFCDDLAASDPMPHRDRFHVREVPWLFGFLTVVDVLEGGRDYRFSYCGDFWKVTLNADMSGCRLSEAESCSQLSANRPNYDAAVKARAPRYRFGRWIWPNKHFIRIERLIVPFCDDDGEVSMLVIAGHCEKTYREIHDDCLAYGAPRLELETSTPDMMQKAEAA
jgi:hypothetical protein